MVLLMACDGRFADASSSISFPRTEMHGGVTPGIFC